MKTPLTLLQADLGHLGRVERIVETPDPRTVVVFVDDPADAGVRFTTATLLAPLLELGAIGLVAVDGASSLIDTSLISAFPSGEVIDKTAAFLVRQLTMTGAELCHVSLRGSFPLHGVDDPGLYGEALKRFRAGDHSGVNALAPARARVILDNLLTLMLREGVWGAALIVSGLLPRLIGDDLRSRGISHALVVPRSTGQQDWERYLAVMRGEAVPTVREEIACLFCRHECGAPYLALPDGTVLGHRCLLDWLPEAVVIAATQPRPACFACGAIRETCPLDSPAGPLCTQCRDSAFRTLTEAVETAQKSEGPILARLVWPVGQVFPETALSLAQRSLAKGAALEASGDTAGAERAYRDGLCEAPDDAVAWYDLGRAYLETNDHGMALASFERSVQLDPTSYKSVLSLALQLDDIGEPKRAVEYYTKALGLTDDRKLRGALRRTISRIRKKNR